MAVNLSTIYNTHEKNTQRPTLGCVFEKQGVNDPGMSEREWMAEREEGGNAARTGRDRRRNRRWRREGQGHSCDKGVRMKDVASVRP